MHAAQLNAATAGGFDIKISVVDIDASYDASVRRHDFLASQIDCVDGDLHSKASGVDSSGASHGRC